MNQPLLKFRICRSWFLRVTCSLNWLSCKPIMTLYGQVDQNDSYFLCLLYLRQFTPLKFNHAGFLEPVSEVQDQVWSRENAIPSHEPVSGLPFFPLLPGTSHRFHSVVAECRLGCWWEDSTAQWLHSIRAAGEAWAAESRFFLPFLPLAYISDSTACRRDWKRSDGGVRKEGEARGKGGKGERAIESE